MPSNENMFHQHRILWTWLLEVALRRNPLSNCDRKLYFGTQNKKTFGPTKYMLKEMNHLKKRLMVNRCNQTMPDQRNSSIPPAIAVSLISYESAHVPSTSSRKFGKIRMTYTSNQLIHKISRRQNLTASDCINTNNITKSAIYWQTISNLKRRTSRRIRLTS